MQPGASTRRPLLNLGDPPVLVIGVTGHRDLRAEDVQTLAERVSDKIKALQTEFPEARLVLMSALAEGADQLVASVADELGMEIVVPLPPPSRNAMPRPMRWRCGSKPSPDEPS
jgi:hypothetical protein